MPISTADPVFERELFSDKFVSFNTTLTGTGAYTVWDPTTGTKFRLKGYDVKVAVDTTLTGTGSVVLGFWDNANSAPVATVATLREGASKGERYSDRADLREGFVSSAANNNLILQGHATLGAGVVRVSGIVWGEEI